jgi:hypothetical protein
MFSRRPHDALVTVLDGDRDKTLRLQARDVGLNLAFADVKEFGKITVGSVTAALVVERMNFYKQHFFHDRKIFRFPNLFRNPDALEVA